MPHGPWTQTTQNNAIPGLVSGGYIAQLPVDPQVNTSGSTCCYLYYSGNGTTDYKYMLHNCPTSSACMAPGSATSGFTDPARTWSCAVNRELLQTTAAENVGIFGTSAGGSLTLTTLLRAKMEGLPMPGAIGLGTPTVDLSKTGDTLFTNAMVDNVLGTQDGFIRETALLYANGRDLKDPLLSPIYGDVRGFPPAILTSGTRELYLSNTVRMHRKLRAAGVEAVLQVWEGQSHTQYMADITAPETREYHDEVGAFFDRHLGR